MLRQSQPLPVRIALGGVAQPSETLVTAIGPHALTFETTVPVPDVALTLVSSYVGMRGADTQVSHVAAGAEGMTWSSNRQASWASLPVSRTRQACLLDHLAEASDLLIAYGVHPTIDVGAPLPLLLLD